MTKRARNRFFLPRSLILILLLALIIMGVITKPGAGANKAQPSANIVFILDASGSMRGRISGRAKIDIAKDVLIKLIKDLPAGINVGLVAYGHRRKGDCNDVEELAPLAKLNKEDLINKIKALKPKGKTPISHSVQLTAEKLQNLEDETTIVLVSDGKETCGGDPCELVKKLKESGIKFVMHVVGFDVTPEEKQQLECIAKAGGGTYYAARNASEFRLAMAKVVSRPKFKGTILKVTALKDGKPFQAYVQIYRQGEEDRLESGYTDPPKPFSTKLLPGTYDIKVLDDSVPDKPVVELKGVVIEGGKTTEKIAEFTKEGILKITAIKGGKPFQAYVQIYRQGEEDRLESGYTDPPKPFSIKLLPGTYDIKVLDDSVPDKPVVELKGVVIEGGKTTAKIAEFTKEGILKITAIKGGKPFQAYVQIFRQGEEDRLESGYTDPPKPFSIKLLPGTYDIKVLDDSVPDKPVVELKGVIIKSGETQSIVAEF